MINSPKPKRIIVTSLLLYSFLLTNRVFAQNHVTYLKANKAHELLGDGKTSESLNTDDAVIFDVVKGQIIIVSYSAKVYKILGGELKKADDGNPYIVYSVQSADGKKASIMYITAVEKSSDFTTRVVINDYKYPIEVLDGTIRSVY